MTAPQLHLHEEWEWGEEQRQELIFSRNRKGQHSGSPHRLPLLITPSNPFLNPFFFFSFQPGVIGKHLNDLVHIQSTLQCNTAAQEPAEPFPPRLNSPIFLKIILIAQQHQAPLFSFPFLEIQKISFSSLKRQLSPPTRGIIFALGPSLQPRWWRVKR